MKAHFQQRMGWLCYWVTSELGVISVADCLHQKPKIEFLHLGDYT